MREIAKDRLWIGNAGDGRDCEGLLRAGVAAVINLAAEESSPALPRGMIYCHFPINDGVEDDPGVLDVAIRTLVCLLKNEVPTLVYCGAGDEPLAGHRGGGLVRRARRQPRREAEADRRGPAPRRFAAVVGGGEESLSDAGEGVNSMFERFTDRARKAMQLSNEQALRLHDNYIGSEHILLGLAKEGSGVGAYMLKSLGASGEAITTGIGKPIADEIESQTRKLPRTPQAEKVIKYAIDEADKLGHRYVGTEHLVLGMLRDDMGTAGKVLINLGLSLEAARAKLLAILGTPRP